MKPSTSWEQRSECQGNPRSPGPRVQNTSKIQEQVRSLLRWRRQASNNKQVNLLTILLLCLVPFTWCWSPSSRNCSSVYMLLPVLKYDLLPGQCKKSKENAQNIDRVTLCLRTLSVLFRTRTELRWTVTVTTLSLSFSVSRFLSFSLSCSFFLSLLLSSCCYSWCGKGQNVHVTLRATQK